VLLAATLAVEVVAVALSWGLEPAWDTMLYAVHAVHAVTLAGAGALIVSRHPGHRIGWLFNGGPAPPRLTVAYPVNTRERPGQVSSAWAMNISVQ
jgi:hypothetical protein